MWLNLTWSPRVKIWKYLFNGDEAIRVRLTMLLLRWQEVSCNRWNVPLLLTRDRRGTGGTTNKIFFTNKIFSSRDHPDMEWHRVTWYQPSRRPVLSEDFTLVRTQDMLPRISLFLPGGRAVENIVKKILDTFFVLCSTIYWYYVPIISNIQGNVNVSLCILMCAGIHNYTMCYVESIWNW